MSAQYIREAGSLQNHLYARMINGQPEPEIGMGASMLSYSDRNAGSIVKKFEKGVYLYIGVQQDKAIPVGGPYKYGDDIDYRFEPNPDGYVAHYRMKKAGGFWESVYQRDDGRWIKSNGSGLRIGERMEYQDPHF